MDVEGSRHSLREHPKITITEQLAKDIEGFLSRFSNESFAVRLLAKKSGVNEKTIKRLLGQKNKPSYPTLFRLYLVLTDSNSENELLDRTPKIVSRFLKDKRSTSVNVTVPTNEFDFFKAIEEQPLVGELYVLAATGELQRNNVLKLYGQFGMEIVEFLVKQDLLKQVNTNVYTLSPNGPVFDGKVIKSLGGHFLKRFSKPSNASLKGQNALGFYADTLNEAGYQKWLSIDEKAFYEKVKLAKDEAYQGDIPAFTLGVTDTIESDGGNNEV